MTQRLAVRSEFRVSPTKMLACMTDPDLLVRQHRMQGALDVMVVEQEHSRHQLIQEVKIKEYRRNLQGLDKSKIVDAQVVYSWELTTLRCSWRYQGPRGRLVQLSGQIQITLHEKGCRVASEVEVRVLVPIVGRLLENRIAKEIQAGFGPYEELLHASCNEA